eukprot:3009176-Pyramimonas_sp.AAC.1
MGPTRASRGRAPAPEASAHCAHALAVHFGDGVSPFVLARRNGSRPSQQTGNALPCRSGALAPQPA